MIAAAERIKFVRGDITKCEVDAIVNAANETLLGGGGVDGAIHRAAGPQLLTECRALGGCRTGQAKITQAYNLPARHVIHTVGPIYHGGAAGEAELLACCYQQSLELARDHECRSVAFPAISCGVYGYPIADAARIAIDTICGFLGENTLPESVLLVLFSAGDFDAYAAAM
jgi:O-acetyl-ADP-ribose deacetylase (regulator of RNase III)